MYHACCYLFTSEFYLFTFRKDWKLLTIKKKQLDPELWSSFCKESGDGT